MNWIQQLASNRVLLLAISAWLVAQILKTLLTLFSTRRFHWERMVGAGGMPSAHSASVCALATGISRTAGLGSPLFAMAFLFAIIVMYDAMGVRRAAGEHAKALNRFVLEDEVSRKELEPVLPLKESLGHTPLEVTAGALLGILIGILFPM
ncbi:MAG: divergent PAP2 family protein [Massiliimalia sp.]|jgi:acid phosphatase family membrane protein YuiD